MSMLICKIKSHYHILTINVVSYPAHMKRLVGVIIAYRKTERFECHRHASISPLTLHHHIFIMNYISPVSFSNPMHFSDECSLFFVYIVYKLSILIIC